MTYMRHTKICFLVIITASTLFATSCRTSRLGKPVGSYSVDSVFATIHEQFTGALEVLKNNNVLNQYHYKVFPTEADLVLDNVVTADAGGSLSILVFKPSYTYTKKKETTLTFSLLNTATPPTAKAVVTQNFDAKSIKFTRNPNVLRDLIVSTAEQMARLQYNFDKDNPKATQRAVEIDIAFTVDNNYGIDISGSLT